MAGSQSGSQESPGNAKVKILILHIQDNADDMRSNTEKTR